MRLKNFLKKGWFTSKKRKGQIMAIMALSITVLIGAMSLGVDVANFYYNFFRMQTAADSAVLAGANYLPDNPSQAKATASQIAETNGVNASEIQAGYPYVPGNDSSIQISLLRTVPWYFGRVLGLTTSPVAVSATASPQQPASTVGASTPAQVQNGDNNGNNGSYSSTTGAYDLMPIGLDNRTAYSDGMQITLQQGQVGPGNWDLLALGGVGANNLRSNIAGGYSGPISVGDWPTTEPGKKVGPIDQGFQDRLTLGQSLDPSGTFSSHTLTDPRVLVLPVVNWAGQNGRSQVEVVGFASVWLDSYNGGKVTVNFISQVIPNSFGNGTAQNFGARGQPFLIK